MKELSDSETPLDRMAKPQEIGGLVVYLGLDVASYVMGAT